MPIYEYQCDSCQQTFEQMRRITDETIPQCPTCNSADKVHKLISLSAFHLKGSGWYVTDYGGKKNGASATDGGSNGDSNGNGNGTAKTESKPTTEKTEKPAEKSTTESKAKPSTPAATS